MDIEFHYYMTHLIALRAGFKTEDAHTIAFAGIIDERRIVYRPANEAILIAQLRYHY